MSWVVLVVWSITGLTGCTNYNYALGLGVVHVAHPSLNPFSTAIISEPDLERGPPRYNKVVFLLHGWHGDASSFGNLADLLQRDHIETHAVYSLSYWSNLLGPNFRKIGDFGTSLADLLQITIGREGVTDLSIVAHSMGGLIARDALLKLKERAVLSERITVRLILVATPTRGAELAIWYDKIIGGITAPLTYLTAFAGNLLGLQSSLVWDRQAHDMRHLNVVNQDRWLAPVFIADQTVRWSEAWDQKSAPLQFAVIGITNGNGGASPTDTETDSVVHAADVPFNHVPSERRCYVTERHWDGIADITARSHRVYSVINAMLDYTAASSGNNSVCPPDTVQRRPTWIVVVRDRHLKDESSQKNSFRLELQTNDDSSPKPPLGVEFLGMAAEIPYALFAGPTKLEAENSIGTRHKDVVGSFLLDKSASDCHYLSVMEHSSRVTARFAVATDTPQSNCPDSQNLLRLAYDRTNILHLSVPRHAGGESFRLCKGNQPGAQVAPICIQPLR